MSSEQDWLARGTISLTLMLMGFDRKLDDQLKILRQVLKDKNLKQAAFNKSLEDVEKTYDQLEGKYEKDISTYQKMFEALIDLNLPNAGELLAPIQQRAPVLSELLAIAEPLAKHIQIVSESSTKPDNEENELLRENLSSRFVSLLDLLLVMGNKDPCIKGLINSLKPAPDWKTLDIAASKAIELLQDRLNDDKEQFQAYLATLNKKLTRINEIVEADSTTLGELKILNIDFNSSINKQMLEAREQIDQHNKVDSLKSELLDSLDSITLRLEDYQSNYDKKLEELQTSKHAMNAGVQSLERDNLKLIVELQKERKLSMLDTLTQLPNRQGFDKRLIEELSRAARYSHPISIAIIDIDLFKRINDKFGHLIGDKVLKMIANEMKKNCRSSDYIARYGGEEFIVILPQAKLEEAYLALEKIRQHVEKCPFHFENQPVPITVSIGVSEKGNDEDIETWINRADQALYQAKGNGRNKVISAQL